MAGLTREQQQVLNTILGVGRSVHATPKKVLAAVETGLVESNLTNPSSMTDHDSQGWRQERKSLYSNPTNVAAAARRFFQEAKQFDRPGLSAGELAARVQRPAAQYRGRYQGRRGDALALLRAHGGTATAGSGGSAGGNVDPSAGSQTTTGQPDLGTAQTLLPLLQALQGPSQPRASAGVAAPSFSAQAVMPTGYQPVVSGGGPAPKPDVNALLAAVQTVGGAVPQTQVPTVTVQGSPDAAGADTGPASSAKFGRSHSPLLELIHNTGSGPGYAVKNGKVVSGTQVYGDVWAGHKDHVHVAAGPKTVVQLGKLAQQMGLNVGENPHFGTVHQVHAQNSYHYKGEAIDVSGDPRKMNQFARRVESLYGVG
jgi:hypothetical protein